MAVFAPDEGHVVDAERLNHENPITPPPGHGALREGPQDLRGRARGGLRDTHRPPDLARPGLTTTCPTFVTAGHRTVCPPC